MCFHCRNNHIPFSDGVASGTIYMKKKITCWNIDTLFANNIGGFAGALYMRYNGSITSINCTFLHNHGYTGVMRVIDGVNVTNKATLFLSNTGQYGGAIYMRDWGMCVNTDSHFKDNTGQYGGSIFIIFIHDQVSCINTNCSFHHNFASVSGGAIYGEGKRPAFKIVSGKLKILAMLI